MAEKIIEQIESAEDKESLEPIAEQLGFELSKRKGLETLRAELIEHAEASQGDEKSGEKDKGNGEAQGKSKTAEKSAQKPQAKAQGRRLKSTKNGRVFAWTPGLAKLGHMKEL
jgi:hypothetical protein